MGSRSVATRQGLALAVMPTLSHSLSMDPVPIPRTPECHLPGAFCIMLLSPHSHARTPPLSGPACCFCRHANILVHCLCRSTRYLCIVSVGLAPYPHIATVVGTPCLCLWRVIACRRTSARVTRRYTRDSFAFYPRPPFVQDILLRVWISTERHAQIHSALRPCDRDPCAHIVRDLLDQDVIGPTRGQQHTLGMLEDRGR